MVTPEWVRTMARYNGLMNRDLFAAAGRLGDEERRRDRGAFWGSIEGTLAHLLWADRMWMHRLAGWDKPEASLRESAALAGSFAEMARAREDADARLQAWADALDPAWLGEDLTWFSGATRREMRRPHGVVVAHLFNHQTHHRGQVHAMLTAAGVAPGATDLVLLV
jgi:uncharacterized damage-inducible protein DinB